MMNTRFYPLEGVKAEQLQLYFLFSVSGGDT